MGASFTLVDAFTDRPGAGNPAAVFLLTDVTEPAWMQAAARAAPSAESAFLAPRADGDFDLRWFTTVGESDLCGHATLASAHVLWQDGHFAAQEPTRFHTRSGLLTARRAGAWIELDFPATPVTPIEEPAGFARMLGVRPLAVYRSHPMPADQYHYLAELASEADVRDLTPDFAALATLPPIAVIVTSRAATPGYDFVSRFFAPRGGMDEDPVTGSAHCVLGPYWQPRLGKDTFVAYQASARGGVVRVQVAGERIILGGQAVTVARGTV